MKLGLIGDIHGNNLALEAVLDSAEKQDVELLLITGDIVGYYFWPKEVMTLLSSWDTIAVRGNHEEMLDKTRKNSSIMNIIEHKYGCGLRITLNTLPVEQLDWLTTLPHPREIYIDGSRILLCHGSPWDLNQYIYPDCENDTIKRFLGMNFDWIVFGHTHYPMILNYGTTIIINPGSVGQPRNREPGAHWAIIDTTSQQIQKFIEAYDVDKVVEQARIREPNLPYLGDVLVRI